MNVFSFTGNLGQDCRTNEVNGTSVCNFSVAVKAGFGQYEQTLWLDCALWGKRAESRLPEFLVKGQQVAVSGELSTQERDGKTYLKLRCDSVDLVGGKSDGGGQSQSAPKQSEQSEQKQGGAMPEPVDDFDDDIPFN